MEYRDIPKNDKKKMRAFHETLNPKLLHDEIMTLRKKLFKGARFTKS